jgi:uncharacterized protein (DUF1778 family)
MAKPKTKTKAQSVNEYAKRNYDDIRLQVKKGDKEILRTHAESKGESLSAFIKRAVYATMEIDKTEAELRAMLEQREPD